MNLYTNLLRKKFAGEITQEQLEIEVNKLAKLKVNPRKELSEFTKEVNNLFGGTIVK